METISRFSQCFTVSWWKKSSNIRREAGERVQGSSIFRHTGYSQTPLIILVSRLADPFYLYPACPFSLISDSLIPIHSQELWSVNAHVPISTCLWSLMLVDSSPISGISGPAWGSTPILGLCVWDLWKTERNRKKSSIEERKMFSVREVLKISMHKNRCHSINQPWSSCYPF